MQAELARLPDSQEVQAPLSADVRRQCYKCFKNQYPNKYIDFLETWKETEELVEVGAMVAQHQQLFNKSVKNFNHLISFSSLSKAHAIEGSYILAGRVINQDSSLGHAFTTPGAEGFFLSRCQADTGEIIGHFKAHIYNKVSLDGVTKFFKSTTEAAKEIVAGKGKGKQRTVDDKKDQSNEDISFGLKFASQKLFPWKALLGQLATNTLVMYNWPVDVVFPGEDHHSKGSGKGILDLTLAECSKLIAALTDASSSKLYIFHLPKMKVALIELQAPVIISTPPSHDLKLSKGKHLFANRTIDYLGPNRLSNPSATRIKRAKTQRAASVDVDKGASDINESDVEEVPRKPSNSTTTSGTNFLSIFPPQWPFRVVVKTMSNSGHPSGRKIG
ncbi:hypothetical protein SCLCIDRAFT_140590 [Scleroderma citrinum Foug A]|uniref:Uncharacterized protein n=1 Tax=Scleroderma citrinum Foug A TaxID=1036808 RepID=A0A0C3CVW5_9AGAM|nr:hypothetical protein SCLCIDRAFT_140590 [Scleroderma citrinum Foug A]